MKYVNLGRSGLKVSRLCLGCMSYGEPERLPQPWSLDEKASRPLIRQALEAGINFFDTANIYSGGSSEEITGKALREMARRDEIVVATKTFFPWRNSPNTGFLSRKAIFQSIDDSLMRLGMDYVDLFQIHRFDHSTPVEETMEALHDLVKAGKVRYIGASSMEAWRFAKMQHTAERNGWTRFITMQPQYNLLYREEEREMLPLCEDQGVGVIPWSPMLAIICMTLIFICLIGYWKSESLLMVTVFAAIVGCLIYVPQFLASVQTMEIVPSFAVGSAVGLRGFMSYIFGASLGTSLFGVMVDKMGWHGGFYLLMGGIVCCILFCYLSHRGALELEQQRKITEQEEARLALADAQ